MLHAKKFGSMLALALFVALPAAAADQRFAANHGAMQSQPVVAGQPAPMDMPAAGKKVPLPGDRYFTWEFDSRPTMGTVVFKIRVFDKEGVQQSSLRMLGEVDMPSMRGHHSSGSVEFKLNKKGDYLLPVNLVMRGEWEVAVLLLQGDQPIYRGYTRFRI
jgi:hypothetical protein